MTIRCLGARLIVFFALLLPWAAPAQVAAVFVTGGPNSSQTQALAGASACVPYSGILAAVAVPVNGQLNLFVQIGSPQTMDLVFQLKALNPSFVAAGNKVQGFLPQVTIPAGQTVSNAFTIFGVMVGKTLLNAYLLPDTVNPVISIPAGAWGVTNTTGSTQLLDANDPSMPCRDPGSPSLSTTPSLLATCGSPVKGVASDGVNPLLLRTESGLDGTVCYQITSTSSLDQGAIQTPSAATMPIGSLNYGFSAYMPPAAYGDSSDSRAVTIQFALTPSGPMTNTTTVDIKTTIVRPPVVLIHGLWAHGSDWNDDYLRKSKSTDLYTTYPADYSRTNAASFATNQGSVQGFVAEAIKRIRAKKYAATQADVVGHSMGGILARLYSGLSQYMRPDNFNMGDIHRMITLDTPHFGSNFANLLVALHASTPGPTETTVTNLTKGSVTQGAVCDLAQNSTGLQALSGGSTLTAQFLTGTNGPPGTPAAPAKYWGGVAGFSSFESALTASKCTSWQLLPPKCLSRVFVFPQATVDAFRFREMNDAVVPLSSQQGGLSTSINFTSDIHFHVPVFGGGITDDSAAATTTYNTLDGPATGLASSLPAVPSNGTGAALPPVPGLGAATDAANYKSQCSGAPLRLNATPAMQVISQTSPDPRLTVTSPAAGTQFHPGDTLSITVAIAPGLTAADVAVNIPGIGRLDGTNYNGSTYQASLVFPNPTFYGPLTITPEITDTSGNYILGPSIMITVVPTATLTSVQLVDHNFRSLLPPATQQLYLKGIYSDGSEFDISSPLMGTTWSSSDTSVLTVDTSGGVTLVNTGIAVVTANNGSLTDFASFVVENPASPLPPTDFTSQIKIQRSGLVLNRNTGFFVQNVALTNTSPIPLAGPLYLVVSGLPSGISLININGVTANIAPVGSGFFTLPLAGESLTMLPGQVVNILFQFLNPNRIPINYSLHVNRTSVTP